QGDVEKGLEAWAAFARAEACRPASVAAELGEWQEFWNSAKQAAAANCCRDLPLAVISQDPARPKPGWSAAQIAAQPIWSELPEALKRLSSRGRRVIARGSGHHVMIDRPDVVAAAIRDVLREVRGGEPTEAYATTTTR